MPSWSRHLPNVKWQYVYKRLRYYKEVQDEAEVLLDYLAPGNWQGMCQLNAWHSFTYALYLPTARRISAHC